MLLVICALGLLSFCYLAYRVITQGKEPSKLAPSREQQANENGSQKIPGKENLGKHQERLDREKLKPETTLRDMAPADIDPSDIDLLFDNETSSSAEIPHEK